jgi:hypothetical protein
MTTKDEALKLAKECGATTYTNRHFPNATALTFSPLAWEQFCNKAFAAPVQEPVAFKHVCNLWIDPVTTEYIVDHCDHPPSECIPAYIGTPPNVAMPLAAQRQWVGLTDEEWSIICEKNNMLPDFDLKEEIEAKLKKKSVDLPVYKLPCDN